MELKVPYSKMELKMSLMTASVKIERYVEAHGEEKAAKEVDAITQDINSPALLNAKVAELHGITVTDLINSPNYSVLKQEFLNGRMKDAVNHLKSIFSLDDSEAWAVVMAETL